MIEACNEDFTRFELDHKDIDGERQSEFENRNKEERKQYLKRMEELLKHCTKTNYMFFFKANLKYAQLLFDVANDIGYSNVEAA